MTEVSLPDVSVPTVTTHATSPVQPDLDVPQHYDDGTARDPTAVQEDANDEEDPESPVLPDNAVANDMEAAAARELKRKADEKRRAKRMLKEQERRRARDAAEKRRKELMELHHKQLVASSLQVLELTRALFDLVEVLPREQVIKDDDGSAEGGDDEEGGDGGHGGPSVRLVITNVFLLHVFESICCRLGIVHQRRKLGAVIGRISGSSSSAAVANSKTDATASPNNAAPGASSSSSAIRRYERGNLNPQHQSSLASIKDVEVPTDVVRGLQLFISLHVVPTPVTIASKPQEIQFDDNGMPISPQATADPPNAMPFDITSDDDIWSTVIQSTQEWLTILQVDETLFDVEAYRSLLSKLSPPFAVKRLTRVLREVTRDFVAVIKGAGDALAVDASSTAKEDTLNMSRASASLSTVASRSIGSAGSLRTMHRRGDRTPSAERQHHHGGGDGHRHKSPRNAMEISGAPCGVLRRSHSSLLPPRPDGSNRRSPTDNKKHRVIPRGKAAVPLVTVVSPHRSALAGSSVVVGGGTIVGGTFTDPPLARPTYYNIVPSRSVRQHRDTDVLRDVERLEFGIEVGEPPVASTQARTVLQARCSHYLYTARELPVIAPPPTVVSGGGSSHSRAAPATATSAAVSATSSASSASLPLHLKLQDEARQQRRSSRHGADAPSKTPPPPHLMDDSAATIRNAAASRMGPGGKIRPNLAHAVASVVQDARRLPLAQQFQATLAVSCAKSLKYPAAAARDSLTSKSLDHATVVLRDVLGGALHRHHSSDEADNLANFDDADGWHMCLPRGATAQWIRQTQARATPTAAGPAISPHRSPPPRISVHDDNDEVEDDDPSPATLRGRMTPSLLVTHSSERPRSRQHPHLVPLQLDGSSSPTKPAVSSQVQRSCGTQQPAQRTTARHATLLALQRKQDTAHLEGEPIAAYWQRLQALEFKLAVIRGSTMPMTEMELWKLLWIDCHACMDEVFEVLKLEAASISAGHRERGGTGRGTKTIASATNDNNTGVDSDAAHHQHQASISDFDDLLGEPIFALALVDSAVAAALVARLDDMQAAVRDRVDKDVTSASFNRKKGTSGTPPNYARQIVRKQRDSGVEKRFAELGAKAYPGVAPVQQQQQHESTD